MPDVPDVATEDALVAFGQPRFDARWVSLRPVQDADLPFLYSLATDPEISFRWRHRGEAPSYAAFVESLGRGANTQFVICTRDGQTPVGHAVLYDLNLKDRTAVMALAVTPLAARRGWGAEAGALFLRYIFATWDVRKIYAETIAYNLPQFPLAFRRFVEEGRLKEHVYYGGRYWDLVILALYRDRWMAQESRVEQLAATSRQISDIFKPR